MNNKEFSTNSQYTLSMMQIYMGVISLQLTDPEFEMSSDETQNTL